MVNHHSFFLTIARGTIDEFKLGFGLFYDIWSPIAEAIIFLIVALIGGHFWGLAGILLGPIVSLIIIPFVWRPYFLFKKGMKLPVSKHWYVFFIDLIFIVIAYIAAEILTDFLFSDIISKDNNWKTWITEACVYSCIVSINSFSIMYVCSPNFRNFITRLKYLRKSRK